MKSPKVTRLRYNQDDLDRLRSHYEDQLFTAAALLWASDLAPGDPGRAAECAVDLMNELLDILESEEL